MINVHKIDIMQVISIATAPVPFSFQTQRFTSCCSFLSLKLSAGDTASGWNISGLMHSASRTDHCSWSRPFLLSASRRYITQLLCETVGAGRLETSLSPRVTVYDFKHAFHKRGHASNFFVRKLIQNVRRMRLEANGISDFVVFLLLLLWFCEWNSLIFEWEWTGTGTRQKLNTSLTLLFSASFKTNFCRLLSLIFHHEAHYTSLSHCQAFHLLYNALNCILFAVSFFFFSHQPWPL